MQLVDWEPCRQADPPGPLGGVSLMFMPLWAVKILQRRLFSLLPEGDSWQMEFCEPNGPGISSVFSNMSLEVGCS